MSAPRVVVTDATFDGLDVERRILEDAGFEVVVADCRTPEQVVGAGQGASALVVQYAPITAEVLDALPAVRVVSRYGVGVDTVDVPAATARGVWVANVPDYGTEEVAAHTVAMLLALVRHLAVHDRQVRAGVWDVAAAGPYHRLGTMTLGLIGLGRIGRTVAERAGPWFARTVAHDPYLDVDDWPTGIERLELDEVAATSDVLSLHLPLDDATRGLVDAPLLDLVSERGIYLVNTARGGLVDLDAVLDGLDRGRIRGAALDVLPEEPPDPQHPLLTHPRVLVTPHAAWYSEESEVELRQRAAENIVVWHRTGRPHSAVNDPG